MLVHWVKVIWAKDGGSGTPWGLTIIFSEKKSASLNSMTLEHIKELYNTFKGEDSLVRLLDPLEFCQIFASEI